MVNVYETLRDEKGNWISGLTKLFVITTMSDGSIGRFESGVAVPSEACTLFIVDDWLIDQVDKLQFIDGTLSIKENEKLVEPVKSEKELQREALLKQLAELESQPSE